MLQCWHFSFTCGFCPKFLSNSWIWTAIWAVKTKFKLLFCVFNQRALNRWKSRLTRLVTKGRIAAIKKVWEEIDDVRAWAVQSFYVDIQPLSTRLMKSNFLFISLADSGLQFFFLQTNFFVCWWSNEPMNAARGRTWERVISLLVKETDWPKKWCVIFSTNQ